MFFAWDITISAGTAEASPKTQTLKLSAGVITGVDVKFPSGCHGLVKVRLMHWEFQLIPLSRGEWITGDGEAVNMPTYYELATRPYELKFEGCSPSTVYPHVVTVRVSIVPAEIAAPWAILRDFVTIVKKLIGIE